ncbi:MAG: GNAT family N-acetyltransferase [Luteolibacter sp.]
MQNFPAEFEALLYDPASSYDSLLGYAQELKSRGCSQREVYRLFDFYAMRHRDDADERIYDNLLDVMDLIWGSCSPHKAMWPPLRIELLADHPEAIPMVAGWYFHEWGKVVPGNSLEQTVERLQQRVNRDHLPLHFVAIEESGVVGVAQLKRHEMDIYPEREFWLGGLFVAPEARRFNVGRRLADHVAKTADSIGFDELFLQTEALDGGFYKWLGWKILETVDYHGVRVAVMRHSLKDPQWHIPSGPWNLIRN